MQLLRTKKNHTTSWDKKNHTTSRDKKNTQCFGTKKITQLFGTKITHATSRDNQKMTQPQSLDK